MNLLLPSSLIFLSFLAIPIMFHFFNKALIKKVDFSTISFIKKLEESAIRKVEIKKWMLLLIRLLMIVMLVILFSRPVTKGFMPGWLSAEMDSKLLLVIDNSSSMSAKFGASNMLDLSKESAKLLPQAFSKKTSVEVIQTCPPKVVFSGNIKDPNISLVIDQISETVNYDNLWFVIDSLMENIRVDEAIKECVIFSDFETKSTPDNIFIKKDWKTYFIKPGGVENNLGISNHVLEEKMLEELVLSTSINNLDILVSGPIPNNPSDVLVNKKFSEMMRKLKQEYDVILIDTPPLGLVADALNLMKYSDINLYVVRQDYTKNGLLAYVDDMNIKERLGDLHIVFNDIREGNSAYSYSYGYGYGYGYLYDSYDAYIDNSEYPDDNLSKNN